MKFRILLATTLVFAFSLLTSAVFAQDAKTRKVPALSEPVYKKLGVVQEYLNPEDEKVEPNFRKALEELNDINVSKFNEYEKANVYNLYGFTYYSLENYPEAIKNYKLVIAQSPNISLGMEQQTYKTIAQLLMITENYAEAIKTYKQYMTMAEIVGADDYFYLGQAYYATNDLNNSLENVDIAVKMMEDSNRVPKEQWYDLQRGLYYEKENYTKVIQIIEKMIVHYNKGKYWYQLAGMYGVIDQTKNQLQAYNAAYLLGALDKERDILNLAYLNLDAEYPYRAAQALEKGMKDGVVPRTTKNLETLGTALRMAQEIKKSIPVIEEAAGKSDDGNLYAQLASSYFQSDDYTKAVEAAEKAISRKGLRQPGNLHLTLGMSLFYLNKYDDAIKSFREASKNKGSEKSARSWIQYCESEKERKAKLAEA